LPLSFTHKIKPPKNEQIKISYKKIKKLLLSIYFTLAQNNIVLLNFQIKFTSLPFSSRMKRGPLALWNWSHIKCISKCAWILTEDVTRGFDFNYRKQQNNAKAHAILSQNLLYFEIFNSNCNIEIKDTP
jgi:hypothetical protein